MIQQLFWDEETNKVSLVTKNNDGSMSVEPLTIKEASQWTAENKF